MFQYFSPTCEIQFLKTCPEECIRLLSERIVNLLQGKLQQKKGNHVLKYRNEYRNEYRKILLR